MGEAGDRAGRRERRKRAVGGGDVEKQRATEQKGEKIPQSMPTWQAEGESRFRE